MNLYDKSAMWSNLIIFHSDSKDRDRVDFPELFFWKTCMRTVYLGDSRTMPADFSADPLYTVTKGYSAYRLLLEIVCGLRSKLLGETEVLAQFKDRFSNSNLPSSPFGEYLIRLRDVIIEDSKKIRFNYLRNLGDQSYGGMAHRYLKSSKKVTLFGTGGLARKILPWVLENNREIELAGRNFEKLDEIAKKFPIKKISFIEDVEFDCEAVIIAAPIPFSQFINQLHQVNLIIDFRENHFSEKFPDHLRYISFAEMLNSLKKNEERNEKLKKKLTPIISEIVKEREMQSHQFVFGWEDIPCYTL